MIKRTFFFAGALPLLSRMVGYYPNAAALFTISPYFFEKPAL